MYGSAFQILFLGEDQPWSKLSQTLAEAPGVSVKIHRTRSLNELFLVLAGGSWHAVALDAHAWNFQGLHFVEKVRSEYPALPIIALYSPAVPDLHSKAIHSGASRCLAVEHLTAGAVHDAVLSCLSENKSESHLRRESQMPLSFVGPGGSELPASKNQIISHALNNLLCVISSNADILEDHLQSTGPDFHSIAEIKKAAKSAAELMRHLK
jgi:CheY-like chemotaxis protein